VLKEDCARILLFRGADRSVKNFANQTAAEVAIIANNAPIAELIDNFKASDVGKPLSTLITFCSFSLTSSFGDLVTGSASGL